MRAFVAVSRVANFSHHGIEARVELDRREIMVEVGVQAHKFHCEPVYSNQSPF